MCARSLGWTPRKSRFLSGRLFLSIINPTTNPPPTMASKRTSKTTKTGSKAKKTTSKGVKTPKVEAAAPASVQ